MDESDHFFHEESHKETLDHPDFIHDRHELSCRMSVFGGEKVGKTKIVGRIMNNKYTETYVPTVEEYHKSLGEYSGVTLTLEIIDTSGREQFPAMRKLNMQKSNLILLVYDVHDQSSIKEVKRLYHIAREVTRSLVIVVGAKADFLPNMTPDSCEYLIQDVTSFINSKKDKHLLHCLCSARTGQNIDEIMEEGLASIFIKITAKLGATASFWDTLLHQHDDHPNKESNKRHGIRCILKDMKVYSHQSFSCNE